MKIKILSTDIYFQHFHSLKQGTVCAVEQEVQSGELYFFIQTFLPKSFFGYSNNNYSLDPFIGPQIQSLDEMIYIKFELFGIGTLGDSEAFIFKPWVLEINNPMLFSYFEDFHLYIPDIYFFNLIEKLIFSEQLELASFKDVRVLQDVSINKFQMFGLDRENIEHKIETSKLVISRVKNPNKLEIIEFFSFNWVVLSPQLEYRYFIPNLNFWFQIDLKSSARRIGFVRLYNSSNQFNSGFSLEYIIQKEYRNKGFAKESVSAIIQYLIEFSYALIIGAQVNERNEYSIKLLKHLGFNETKSTNPLHPENFYLFLINKVKEIEHQCNENILRFSIQRKYAIKFSRYF